MPARSAIRVLSFALVAVLVATLAMIGDDAAPETIAIGLPTTPAPLDGDVEDVDDVDDVPEDAYHLEGPASVTARAVRGESLQLTEPPAPPVGPVPPAPGPGGRVIHLTFDDGPSAYTSAILDHLARYGARATFFVVGNQVSGRAGLVRRMASEGHTVANHTWSHPSLAGISYGSFAHQIGSTQDVIASVAGRRPTCLRPPYGATDRNTAGWAAQWGLGIAMWTIDPQDWRGRSASAIASHVISRATPGAVVLLHDGGGVRHQTVIATGIILSELSARGYRFTPMPGC